MAIARRGEGGDVLGRGPGVASVRVVVMTFSAQINVVGGQAKLVDGDVADPRRPGASASTSRMTPAIAPTIFATSAQRVRSGRRSRRCCFGDRGIYGASAARARCE
jgi:hypothetical protein